MISKSRGIKFLVPSFTRVNSYLNKFQVLSRKMGTEQSLLGKDFPIAQSNCRIVVVGSKSGDNCLLALSHLPAAARIIATGNNLAEIQKDGDIYSEGNVLLNVSGTSETLTEIINAMPFLVWVHSVTAGVDHIKCPALFGNSDIVLTNAKGVFSSTLAEYTMFACSYFAKNAPRWIQQQQEHKWEKYCVRELRGATMGIVGYGNIGAACAKLAKAYGMRIIALRRNPELSRSDCNVDHVYGTDELDTVMAQSDYLVVCMALTEQTRHMLRAPHFRKAKKGQVLINIGRGALLDENALVEALQRGDIAAAALDVFTVEPLPKESPLWDMPNVLVSPHNADLTEMSRYSSVEFFTKNCDNFVSGRELECVVDKEAGY